jgi:hypothetical protein
VAEDAFGAAQQWLFEAAVQPVMFALGLGGWKDGYAATGWLLVGLLQIAGAAAGHRPAATLAPGGARHRPARHPHRRALHAHPPAGPVPHGLFFLLQPFFDDAFGALHVQGIGAPSTSTKSGPASPTCRG